MMSWRAPWRTGAQPLVRVPELARDASQGDLFGLVIVWHILPHHHAVGVFEVFFQLLQRLPLRHDFGVFQELSQPELLALPAHHGQSGLYTRLLLTVWLLYRPCPVSRLWFPAAAYALSSLTIFV